MNNKEESKRNERNATIGGRIYSIRKHFGISREELCRGLYISYRDLKDVERNEAIPSDCMIELIALKYGISHEWIEDGTGEMLEENNESIFAQLSNYRCLSPRKGYKIAQSISRIRRELDYISRLLPAAALQKQEVEAHENDC